MSSVTANRFKLLGMAALFFAPMIIAAVLYYGPDDWKPHGRTAKGMLVDPARPVPKLSYQLPSGEMEAFDELWTVLHIATAPCLEDCQYRLWQTRQMRTLLHRRRGRVQRGILIAQGEDQALLWSQLQEQHPRLKVLSLTDQQRAEFDSWLGALPVVDPVLLIDPLGNFLMYYGDELPLKGMHSDIKRVLKLSNIG
ncbi:MAG: hypothetical protein ACSHXK_08880 [Oceanococcus sp.]